uniref:C2 domain-containing protein n=1 Tax=Ciona intestinalis TaxID=7719 RepID=F6W790_CIOIN
MPGRLKVRVLCGRHLPVMDRASELTDAFVEVKFGSITYKTEVFGKSLNPVWNSEWFKFEVDDEHLQDEPLQIRVLDHDTYSTHDVIGKVYLDIDPLLDPQSSHSLCGWFPIYDTMHGIRGEIQLKVKLELFADYNQFKQSSCGLKFICGTSIPDCFIITAIHGFVEELLVNEDPEYKWIDKLRTPRASNEARQRLFSKMSGELQRRIGSKVENTGGNAVIGYQQAFDIEGDSGIVVRGIGTAVSIEEWNKKDKFTVALTLLYKVAETIPKNSESLFIDHQNSRTFPNTQYMIPHLIYKQQRQLSIPSENVNVPKQNIHLSSKNLNPTDGQSLLLQEHPFYTLLSYPENFISRLSFIVSARSVKLLEKIHNQDDAETRDSWWSELRQEIHGHCNALGCNAVLGYSEYASICDEMIILSAQGTAAVVDLNFKNQDMFHGEDNINTHNSGLHLFIASTHMSEQVCPMSFLPSPCDPNVDVYDVIFATIDLPSHVSVRGKGTFIQARFCRSKKKGQGESNASLVSEILPFIEYELHKQLLNKLKLIGMNAIFGLKTKITLGENLIIGVASGTAVYLNALPAPEQCYIHSFIGSIGAQPKQMSSSSNQINSYTKKCQSTFDLNDMQVVFIISCVAKDGNQFETLNETSSKNSTDELDLSIGDKNLLAVVLEDSDDEREMMSLMEDHLPPALCFMSNLEKCPGLDANVELMQTFQVLWRVRYQDEVDDVSLNMGLRVACDNALRGLWFKLRMKSPICYLNSLRFQLVLPDDDELQVWITGSAVVPSTDKKSNQFLNVSQDSALQTTQTCMAPLRESVRTRFHSAGSSSVDNRLSLVEMKRTSSETPSVASVRSGSPVLRKGKRSGGFGNRFRFDSGSSGRSRYHSESGSSFASRDIGLQDSTKVTIEIVASAHVPGRKVKRHIGILNMFIIRETTAVRGSTGSCWFVTRALAETQSMVRAHVVALGGNALTSYKSSYCVLEESLAKNEAQCLFHVCGDVVL